jgi:hypothetical protein
MVMLGEFDVPEPEREELLGLLGWAPYRWVSVARAITPIG